MNLKISFIYLITFFVCISGIYSQSSKSPYLNDVLNLKITGNGRQDNLYIAFMTNSTQGYDSQLDVKKMFGAYEAPQFYSIINDTLKLSINCVPFPLNNYSVQLGLSVGKDTSYSITAIGAGNFTYHTVIFLEDTKNSGFINLVQQPTYSFNSFISDTVTRFKVHFPSSTSSLQFQSNEIQIYSFGKSIFIQNKGNEIIESFEIYDIIGKLLQKGEIHDSNSLKFNVDLSANVYLMSVLTKKNKYSQKLVIY